MISIILPNHNEVNLKLVQEAITSLPFNCQVVIVSDPNSEGKGIAIREGLKLATGETIIFLDADMDIHPRMILRLLPFLVDYDIVVGTKKLKNVSLQRKFLTILSRFYIKCIFGLRIDTQTGLKMFKRDCIPAWQTNGFAFDIEILAKAKKSGYKMIEVPIEATITKNMSFKSIWFTLMESIKIWFRLLFPAFRCVTPGERGKFDK